MTMMRWFRTEGPRGTPAFRRATARHPVILLCLAVTALAETGCQSGFCGPCNKLTAPLATGFRSLRERVSRPFASAAPGGACCGSEMGGESAPLQYGPSLSPSVVSPGPSTLGPTTITPGPAGSFPSDLEPIPSAKPGPPPTGTDSSPGAGARSSTGKATYEAFRPKSQAANSEPTTRSARGSGRSKPRVEPSPLDNLPPIDVPNELTRSTGVPTADRTASAEPTNPVAAAAPELAVAPGIRRFAGVESKLAGGSVPDSTGLDWLSEKGYKTVLDLREEAEISPGFIAEVSRKGMRYLSLPVSATTLDAERMARFHFELSLSEARPLYFFDADGTRPGAVWYVHRVTVDKVDAQVAHRDAEELGLKDERFWAAANALLPGSKPAAAPAPAPAPDAAPALPSNPPPPAPTPDDKAKPQAAANAPAAPSAGPRPSASNEPAAPRDPTAWRSVAAMLVTGLGVPLAYVSRTAFPTSLRSAARASLTSSARTRKSLPPASGV